MKLIRKKRLRKKKRTSIQKRKLVDTLFAKYISLENVYILAKHTVCLPMMKYYQTLLKLLNKLMLFKQ